MLPLCESLLHARGAGAERKPHVEHWPEAVIWVVSPGLGAKICNTSQHALPGIFVRTTSGICLMTGLGGKAIKLRLEFRCVHLASNGQPFQVLHCRGTLLGRVGDVKHPKRLSTLGGNKLSGEKKLKYVFIT
jgi:hypothetical protein